MYPIVIFSFKSPLAEQPNMHEVVFPDLRVLTFRYRAIQLNRLNWRDFPRADNPVASALMVKKNIAKADRPRVKFECMRMLARLRLDMRAAK